MNDLLPLPVAIPLLTAAALTVVRHVAPRRVNDVLGICAAAAATGISLAIMVESRSSTLVYWFGGWHPRGSLALGVGFAADPFGAGMAALACALVTLSLVYSWTYMEDASDLFVVLMLVFCGAMAGFALTGDLFNMFVWFELMGVAAYALAGFRIESLGPVQGALNFAISNTFGAYLILLGIGLLYARTGALNLAQIGHALAAHRSDRVVVVALTLLLVGFLVKAAIVPFHFWLADAHAVAPAPVCVLFSGAMVELGLIAVARVYWAVFSGPLAAHAPDIRGSFVWLGLVTALVGAVMAFLQRHLKRLLAYSTICHAGMILVGIGLLDSKSLAGAAHLVLAHGLLKAGLFFLCGIVLLELGDIDELRLHGAGRRLPYVGALWGAAVVGLIGLPFAGDFTGHSLVDEGASGAGIEWAQPLLMIAAGVAAGAMLRAGARVFLGWGPPEDELLTKEPPESPESRTAKVPLLLAVAGVAVAGGLVLSVVPGLEQRVEQDAARFRDRPAYAQKVLHGVREPAQPSVETTLRVPPLPSWLYGFGSFAVALAVAAFGLWRGRLSVGFLSACSRGLGPSIHLLKAAHSGIVGDYLLWIAAGTALLGGVWAIVLR